ncbi:MAG: cation:proton antiporter [archaeon]
MSSFETLPLTVIGVIILAAIGVSILVKKMGLNPVLGYIFAGFVLGPFLFGYLNPEDPLIMGFGEMGLFVLLFYLGLELSLPSFLKAGAASFGLALIDMTLSAGAGFVIMTLFGFSPMFSIIVGFMLFSTSTAIVAKFCIDRNILHDAAAQLAISILILQDFLGILLLVLITSFSAGGASSIGLAAVALVFAVSTFFAVHHLSQKVGAWLIENGYGHTEVTLYAMGIGLVVATIGVLLGLSAALGAYFAGFALAETPSGSKIKKDVEFMRDFFLVFFFVAFGTTIFYNAAAKAIVFPEIGQMLFIFGLATLLVFFAFLAHLLASSIFGPIFGLSRHDASTTAILLLPLGEFVVIIATVSSKVLTGTESALVSVIAFMLIAVSVILFQPIFNNINHVRFLTSFLPEFFKMKQESTNLKPHTNFTITLLQKIAINIFIVLCLGWITILLYEQLPTFGVPIIYSREVTALLAFIFFAVLPFGKATSAFYNLMIYVIHGIERNFSMIRVRPRVKAHSKNNPFKK